MGIFNRSIPTIQPNRQNQLQVVPQQTPYIDDIFDPILNAEVRKYLLDKYGDPIFATFGGYAEGIDNALLGQDGKWGILGSGMGILSGFGRSMDKAGDVIIGGLTEGVKGLTGQDIESPFHNIFVDDEDYSGGRLLAAMGNSMAGLAKAPKLTEQDFTGLWNIPSMGLELATDPGIMGGMMSKGAKAINLTDQVANQTANSKLASIGKLLQDYDDFTAKAAIDLTVPGLRQSATSLLNKIEAMLGISKAANYSNYNFEDDVPDEVVEEMVSKAAKEDPNTQALLEKANKVSEMRDRISVDNNTVQLGMAAASTPGAIMEELSERNASDVDSVDDLFETRTVSMINRILSKIPNESLEAVAESSSSYEDFIQQLQKQLLNEDLAYSSAESEILDDIISKNKDVNTNLDLRSNVEDSDLLNDYRTLYTTAQNVRRMEVPELNAKSINPEYASLNLFKGKVPPEAIELYLENPGYSPSLKTASDLSAAEQQIYKTYEDLWGNIAAGYGFDNSDEFYSLVEDFVENDLRTGNFYDLTDNEATQNAVYRLAGFDPKSRKVKKLDTPVTFSPSQFAGHSNESYRLGVQASYSILDTVFKKSGFPLEKFTHPDQLNVFINNKTFKGVFPNAEARKRIVDDLRKLLFPDEVAKLNPGFKASAREYMNTVRDLTETIISNTVIADINAKTLASRIRQMANEINANADDIPSEIDEVWEYLTNGGSLSGASRFGKVSPDELFKKVRKSQTLIPWVKNQTGNLKGADRVLFIEDLEKLDAAFNLESSANPQKTLKRIYDLVKRRDEIIKRLETNNPLPKPTDIIYDDVRRAHEADLNYYLKTEFSSYERGLLTRFDNLRLNDFENIPRALETSKAYHKFWENTLQSYLQGTASAERTLVRNLGTAADKLHRQVLDPLDRMQSVPFDHNTLPLFDAFSSKDFDDFKAFKGRVAQGEAKQFEGGRRRIKAASGDQTLRTHTSHTNFYRINSKLFDDPVFFKEFIHRYAPELSKHYEVKLNPEFFNNIDASLEDILVGKGSAMVPVEKSMLYNGKEYKFTSLEPETVYGVKMPERERILVEETKNIIEEFYSIFKDDVDLLLKNGISPLTPLYKFTKRAGQEDIYEALRRVQINLGHVSPNLEGETLTIPKNYKAFRQLFKETFPIVWEDKVPKLVSFENGVRYLESSLPDNPLKRITLADSVNLINAQIKADYMPPVTVQKAYDELSGKLFSVTHGEAPGLSISTKRFSASKPTVSDIVEEAVQQTIQKASNAEAAEIIADFPTPADSIEQKLINDLVSDPEVAALETPKGKVPVPENAPNAAKIVHKKKRTLFNLIHESMAAVSKARNRDRATLRTDFVKKILDDAGSLTRHGILEEDIAKYQRAQTYLSGAKVAKEEFLDTLASSGMIEMAFKDTAEAEAMLKVLNHNASIVNVAAKGNVLKTFKHVLPNGNIATGIMFDTSNKNIVRMLEKSLKNINTSDLRDVVRLNPGSVTESVSKYIGSEKYRIIDEFFDRVRQAEGEYSKVLGFKYDDTRHVKNVRNISPDVAEHYIKYLYKDINLHNLDAISEQFMASPAFKHLRGSWGSRRFDKRLLGYAEDFEDAEIGSLFSHNATQIVKGSLGEGSFNNSKFQLYVDLFQNDNFKINSFVSDVRQLEELFNARLVDGTLSGNMQNLVLAAPRFDNTGRVIGFTQFDKTTRAGLEQALKNKDTVLLPAHVFAPLDKVLRRDAVMSNKVYAFINKHLTTPFKFGVLMNPGFLIGNANDAYLKQATTMAHKYGTSVPEELANVAASIRDVMVLNNEFDNAYRKVLTHIAAEGFTLAPTHHISELAASDPRIRKMLKDYVSNKLQKSKVSPIITCRLSKDEILTIRTWLTLNSSSTTASFAAGLQDMDVIAKAKNSNAYVPNPNVIDRVLMGKGEYVSDDISTWGLMVNNPIARKFMDVSEGTENLFRSAAILNDFRHKGLSTEYFKEYFNAKGSAEFKSKIMEDFDVNLSEAINTMHNANFDYERMTDFTDTVGKFVPFPTFFLKNLGYWLDVFVNHPQYIDHAITVQENMWNGKDTSEDEFAAEAKGRGAIPLTADGQNMSTFFKGIFKPTPLQSMFGAFSLINNPVDDMYYRLHPLLSGGIAAASQLPPLKSIAADTLPQESIKYRPYSTDMYERNVSLGDPNFNPLSYTVHRLNPMERATQNLIRLPDKLEQDKAQLSDFLPSIFQPDF